jgi:hypothetical protein
MIFSAPAVAHPVVVVHHLTPLIAAAAYQIVVRQKEGITNCIGEPVGAMILEA